MILQQVNINDKFTLHEYFSFTEVWSCIRPDSGPYRDSLKRFKERELAPLDQEIEQALEYLETKDPKSSEENTAKAPQAIKSFLQDDHINMDELQKQLAGFSPDFIPEFWARNAKNLKALIQRNDMSFTPATANLLYLFLLLYIQARRNIGEAREDQGALGEMMELLASMAVKEGKLEVAHAAVIRIPAGSEQLTLPYRSATTEGSLELVPIENASGENVSVILGETVLRRSLGSGKRLYALRKGVDPKDNAAVNTLLPEIGLRVDCIDGEQHIYLNGEDVSTAIRTEEAGMAASAVGANPEVRAFLLELQRGMTKTQNVLMDGRDIGTVVLPDATVKIFLTAAPEARARRRWLEYQQKGMEVAFEDVLADVKQRDYQDTHRAAAPLKQAEDAVLLDTSDLNFEQSLAAMKKIIAEKVN